MCLRVHLSKNAGTPNLALGVGEHSSFKTIGTHLPSVSQVDVSALPWRILNQVWPGKALPLSARTSSALLISQGWGHCFDTGTKKDLLEEWRSHAGAQPGVDPGFFLAPT